MIAKKFCGWLGIILLGISLSGCATLKRPGSGEGAQPQEQISLAMASQLKFEDIPVPKGFKLLSKESYVFYNDFVRVGLLKYSGRAKDEQVTKFYKEQMPLYNWQTLNIIEHGRVLLNFEKDDESCVITVDTSFGSSVITIALSPRASSS